VTDHALDAVALAIDAPVPALAIGFSRNTGTDAGLMQAGADGVGNRSPCRTLLGHGDYLFECRAVRRFAGHKVEDERDASGITETMNFTGEPALRTAKSLFASPPVARAAER
jgi:hypothetical protein